MHPIPSAGEIYTSRTDPAITIYIKAVRTIEENKEVGIGSGFFLVKACDPTDQGSPEPYEFTSDEWAEHGFILALAPER